MRGIFDKLIRLFAVVIFAIFSSASFALGESSSDLPAPHHTAPHSIPRLRHIPKPKIHGTSVRHKDRCPGGPVCTDPYGNGGCILDYRCDVCPCTPKERRDWEAPL
jgi:hypothetical protein